MKAVLLLAAIFAALVQAQQTTTYPIVDTGQDAFYDLYSEQNSIDESSPYFGQDANYKGLQAAYENNGDGTITDLNTGLMWQQNFEVMTWADAEAAAEAAATGGYNDWRVPTIKELYSLIMFYGNQGTGNPESETPPDDALPFLDTDYFNFEYPSVNRYIDAQYISSTVYTGYVFNNQTAFFGLNLADGRIKGYPLQRANGSGYYAMFVRGNDEYGVNTFVDNGDGTVTDEATGLMLSQFDSGDPQFESLLSGYTYQDGSLNWTEALDFSEGLEYTGYTDWRLPDAKELQSILDYTRSPAATGSAAIDPAFETTGIVNEDGQNDFPAFWSSTSFNPGQDAVVVFFGRALGYMNGQFMDVHGAGAQRSDPKEGSPSFGQGPQGDVRRVYNYVRVVRDAVTTTGVKDGSENKAVPQFYGLQQNFPNPFNPSTTISYSVGGTGHVRLTVFDVSGREVAELVNGSKAAGTYTVNFNAGALAGGVYFYRLAAGDFVLTHKMLLVK